MMLDNASPKSRLFVIVARCSEWTILARYSCSSFNVNVNLLAASLIRSLLFYIDFWQVNCSLEFHCGAHCLRLLMMAFTLFHVAHLMFWKYFCTLLLIGTSSFHCFTN